MWPEDAAFANIKLLQKFALHNASSMDVAFGVISSVSSAFWAMFGRCRRIKLPPILRLDGELLAGVAERCSPDDLRHLRLACNTLATAGAQCIKRLRFCAADTSHEHLPSRWQVSCYIRGLPLETMDLLGHPLTRPPLVLAFPGLEYSTFLHTPLHQGFTSVEELVIKYANGSEPFKEAELTRVLPQLLGQRQERLVEVRLMQSPEDIKTPLDCLRGLTSLQHLTLEQYYRERLRFLCMHSQTHYCASDAFGSVGCVHGITAGMCSRASPHACLRVPGQA